MQQVPQKPGRDTGRMNPVQDPQLLPISYAMPLITARFASPAASPCLSLSLLDMLFKKKT